jgi:hypothetical protein
MRPGSHERASLYLKLGIITTSRSREAIVNRLMFFPRSGAFVDKDSARVRDQRCRGRSWVPFRLRQIMSLLDASNLQTLANF